MARLRDLDGYSSEVLAHFLKPRGMVLEVGCGEGRNLIWIAANKELKVVGIDINAEYLKKAKSSVTVARADACKLPFKDSSFDCVLCSEVLEHLENPESCVNECRRILKEGGIAVFACPTLNIPLKFLIPIYRKLAGIPKHSHEEHLNVFSAKDIANILKNYFDILEIKYVEFLSVFERRLGIGYSFESSLSSVVAKIRPLRCLASGGWFRVCKSDADKQTYKSPRYKRGCTVQVKRNTELGW